jgi:PUA domain protein
LLPGGTLGFGIYFGGRTTQLKIFRIKSKLNNNNKAKMFKKFSKEDIHSRSNIKSSVQRGLKGKFVSQFPDLEPIIDTVIPKKSQVVVIKCEEKIQLYSIDNEVLLFQHFDDLVPALKTVHKYPENFPRVQVDRGAIKFVLSGANIMCPGLTSKGASLPTSLEKDTIVTIYAEGKENALAVGKLLMSTDDIKNINKGIGIELLHYLGDGLWNFTE